MVMYWARLTLYGEVFAWGDVGCLAVGIREDYV